MMKTDVPAAVALAVGAAYKFAVVAEQERTMARWCWKKKREWRKSEMEQEGGSEAKSGCWLLEKQDKSPFNPPSFPRHGNSLNWLAERAMPGSSL